MRLGDVFKLALQTLRRYPLRTSMMLLAIGIGVAAVVMLTAVGEGARRYVTQQFTALGTHLVIVLPGRAETAGGGGPGLLIGETARDLTLDDAIALRRSPYVSRISPLVIGSGTASWRSRQREITVLGTTVDMLRIQGWKVELGQFLPRMDMSVAAPVCVIGHTVGRELFSTGSPIGKWLRIGEMRCRVIGVLSQLGVSHGFDADETVILPVASAQQLFDTPSVFRILVEVRNIDVVDRAQRDITRIIRARHQGELDFTVITQDAVVATFDSILRMITLGLAGIAAISLVVAGVLIMNVMLVAVSQRTTEIGLLKALGARRAQIVALFLAEAASLSLLGAVAGVALGGAGALILGIVFPALEFVPPAWAVAMAVAIAVSSGMVFGILPARRAARLDPVTALARH